MLMDHARLCRLVSYFAIIYFSFHDKLLCWQIMCIYLGKQPRSLDDACPVGKALTVSERNKLFLCGLDVTKPQCPTFFNCIIQPGMEYGVCCPDAGNCPLFASHFVKR